ncbi:MAG: hypothetical protein AAFY14_10010 [Pseudomonadota bacterium]
MAAYWLKNAWHPNARYLNPETWRHGEPLPPLPEHIAQLRFVAESHVAPPPGWKLVRQTRLLLVHPDTVITLLAAQVAQIHIMPVKPDGPNWTAWIDFHWARYTATHQDNPPHAPDFATREAYFGNDDLVAGSALAVVDDDGAITGIGSLRQATGQMVDIGWFGTLAPDDVVTAAHLLRALCKAAVAQGISTLAWEVDDTDEQLWALHRSMPATCKEVWLTWAHTE